MLAWAAAYLNPTPEPAKRWERTRLLRDAVRIGRLAYFSPTRVQELYDGKKPTFFSDPASSDLLLRVWCTPRSSATRPSGTDSRISSGYVA